MNRSEHLSLIHRLFILPNLFPKRTRRRPDIQPIFFSAEFHSSTRGTEIHSRRSKWRNSKTSCIAWFPPGMRFKFSTRQHERSEIEPLDKRLFVEFFLREVRIIEAPSQNENQPSNKTRACGCNKQLENGQGWYFLISTRCKKLKLRKSGHMIFSLKSKAYNGICVPDCLLRFMETTLWYIFRGMNFLRILLKPTLH